MRHLSLLPILIILAMAGAACDGSDTDPGDVREAGTESGYDHDFTVDIVDGQPDTDIPVFTVDQGDSYRITVTADTQWVVHYHSEPAGAQPDLATPVPSPLPKGGDSEPELPAGVDEGPDVLTAAPGEPAVFAFGSSPFTGRFVLETHDPTIPLAVVEVQ